MSAASGWDGFCACEGLRAATCTGEEVEEMEETSLAGVPALFAFLRRGLCAGNEEVAMMIAGARWLRGRSIGHARSVRLRRHDWYVKVKKVSVATKVIYLSCLTI
jgi:hypothetical protein